MSQAERDKYHRIALTRGNTGIRVLRPLMNTHTRDSWVVRPLYRLGNLHTVFRSGCTSLPSRGRTLTQTPVRGQVDVHHTDHDCVYIYVFSWFSVPQKQLLLGLPKVKSAHLTGFQSPTHICSSSRDNSPPPSCFQGVCLCPAH